MFPSTEHLAAGALVAALLAGALLAALHLLSPEFSPAHRYVSEYVLGRFGALMQAAFVALGAAVLLLALAQVGDGAQQVLTRLAPAALLTAAAICLVGLALYSTDASTEAARTNEGAVHNELAQFGFWLLALGMVAWSALRVATGGSALAWASLGVAVVATVALIVLRYTAEGGPAGAVQRVLVVAVLAWLTVASLALVRLGDGLR